MPHGISDESIDRHILVEAVCCESHAQGAPNYIAACALDTSLYAESRIQVCLHGDDRLFQARLYVLSGDNVLYIAMRGICREYACCETFKGPIEGKSDFLVFPIH